MVVIELGELSATDRAPGPELSHRTRRGLMVGLLVLAILAGSFGSARVEPGLTSPLWTGEVSLVGFTLGTQSLYYAEANGRVMLARDLTTGAPRWRLEIADLPLGSFDLGGGVAAVLTHTPAPGGVDQEVLSFLREETGRVFAVTSGGVVGRTLTGDRLIVAQQRQFGTVDCPEWGDNCADVVSHDIATGQIVGRLSLPPRTSFVPSYQDDRVEAFAMVTDIGDASVYDASSGRLIDHLSLDVGGSSVMLLSDMLIAAHRENEDNVRVTGYRRAPLTKVWSTVLPVDGPRDYPTWWLAGDDCGQAICLRADNRTVLLDRDTGEVRSSYHGEIVGAVGRGVLVGFEVREPGPPTLHPLMIIDPATGGAMTTLDNARAISWTGAGDRALLAQEGPDRTAFLVLTADGRLDSLGSVPGIGLNCQAQGRILACADPGSNLRVWRLPLH